MEFISEDLVRVDNTLFELDLSPTIRSKKSSVDRFVLMKPAGLVKQLSGRLVPLRPEVILEFGIQRGGSVAFFNQLLRPKLHIAIELDREPIAALEEFKDRVIQDGRRLELHYGVDQGDAPRVRSIVETALASAGIGNLDLVLDDASHLYEPSKVSFETVFPLLKPGGQYILEDWGWAHWQGYQGRGAPYAELPALSNLVFQLTMLAASDPTVLPQLIINTGLVFAQRGPAQLPRKDFSLDAVLKLRDKPLPMI